MYVSSQYYNVFNILSIYFPKGQTYHDSHKLNFTKRIYHNRIFMTWFYSW